MAVFASKIRNNDYSFPAEVPVSSHARSLIRWLLQPRPGTVLPPPVPCVGRTNC
jgi:hypothetical protein